jgi:hypothetical protein
MKSVGNPLVTEEFFGTPGLHPCQAGPVVSLTLDHRLNGGQSLWLTVAGSKACPTLFHYAG